MKPLCLFVIILQKGNLEMGIFFFLNFGHYKDFKG